MSDRSAIEWTDATWNPLRALANRVANPALGYPRPGKVGWYCEHVSPACEHCYAESMNHRLGTGLPFKPSHRKDVEFYLDEKTLLAPLRWKKPRMIFVCSMTDLFGAWVKDEWIDRIFSIMHIAGQHRFQVLTKRPERMQKFMTSRRRDTVYDHMAVIQTEDGDQNYRVLWPLPNVWLGTSAEDQQRADERIPLLLDTPAAVRFVSLEPLLSGIDLTNLQGLAFDALYGVNERKQKIDWVIVGGESGHGARPMHPDWARKIRDDCAAAGVPFFFKQWGAFKDGSDFKSDAIAVLNDGRTCAGDRAAMEKLNLEAPVPSANPTMMRRVGKKAAGRLLDGVEWNGMPA